MIRELNTVEEALNFVAELARGDATAQDFKFGGELKSLEIAIHGPNYHGLLTGELAKGIGEFQEEIYGAARFVMGDLQDGKVRLTTEQKKLLQIKVQVSEGCTLLDFLSDDIAAAAINATKEWAVMYPELAVGVGVLVVLAFLGAHVVVKLGGQWLDNKSQKNVIDGQNTLAREMGDRHLKTMELVKEIAGDRGVKVVERFTQAQENGIKEIAHAAPDATKIRVNHVELDEYALSEINARTERISGNKVFLEREEFLVSVDSTKRPVKVALKSGALEGELSLYIDRDSYSQEEYDAIWDAAKNERTLLLDVEVVLVRGAPKRGTITRIYTNGSEDEGASVVDLFGASPRS